MEEQNQKKSGSFIAIATMFALYAMCGFVTYLAAPAGAVWQAQPGINGSNALGMMGIEVYPGLAGNPDDYVQDIVDGKLSPSTVSNCSHHGEHNCH